MDINQRLKNFQVVDPDVVAPQKKQIKPSSKKQYVYTLVDEAYEVMVFSNANLLLDYIEKSDALYDSDQAPMTRQIAINAFKNNDRVRFYLKGNSEDWYYKGARVPVIKNRKTR